MTDRQTDQLDRVCTSLPIVIIITIQATEFIGLGPNYVHKASSADGRLSCGEDPSFYFSVAFSVVPGSPCLELLHPYLITKCLSCETADRG